MTHLTRADMLIGILGEEGSEVAVRASKVLRFGLQEVQVGQRDTNEDRLLDEVKDFLTLVTMLQEEGHLRRFRPNEIVEHGIEKRDKVNRFIRYSHKLGRLAE